MSLSLQPLAPVPEQTRRVAHAAFPRGHAYLRLRDEMGTIFTDRAFAALFPRRGQPAEAPWRLALVTLLQYAEDLSDREAAQAVRSRIDWKYLLGLELEDRGFDFSVLSEFRSRLLAGEAEAQLLDALLERCRERQWLGMRLLQRSDSTHVLAKVQALNRLMLAGETLRAALNVLAVAHPEWLLRQAAPEWSERYGRRIEESRLPRSEAQRQRLAEQIGRDGHRLMAALAAPEAGVGLAQLPAVEVLRRVWLQQFYCEGEQVHWRREAEEGLPPAALRLCSPYEVEARAAKKRSTAWVGYKVHLTESCEAQRPHLITHVETTPAPASDAEATEPIHRALAEKDLLPERHLVDAGYVTAEALERSRQHYGIDLFGPTLKDRHWQAQGEGPFAASAFVIDWQAEQVSCPGGKTSPRWWREKDARALPVLKVRFRESDCRDCAHRAQCTRSGRARSLTLREPARQHALQRARAREREPDFAAAYGKRAGIEGTLSQGVRALGLRRCRYLGEKKTHLQHVATAGAINLLRLAAWLAGETPAQTRQSALLRLMSPSVPPG